MVTLGFPVNSSTGAERMNPSSAFVTSLSGAFLLTCDLAEQVVLGLRDFLPRKVCERGRLPLATHRRDPSSAIAATVGDSP